MNGESINPQDFISAFPYTWFCVLGIILAARCIPGFHPIVKAVGGKEILNVLTFICVYLVVLDLRALFPDPHPLNETLEAISVLLVLVAVIWVMWKVFIKKPKP